MLTYEFDDCVFYYDVDNDELTKKLIELHKEDCDIQPNDIEEEVNENYDFLLKRFEHEINEAFHDKAYQEYLDLLEYQKNPSRYYGV